MTALTKFLISGYVALLLGCSKSGGGGSVSPPAQSVPDVSHVKSFDVISVVPSEESPEYQRYEEQRYTRSCLSSVDDLGRISRYEERDELDPSLSVGDTVYFSVGIHSQHGSFQTDHKVSLKELDDQTALIDLKSLSLQLSQAGGEILKKPFYDELQCGFQMQEEKMVFECNPTQDRKLKEVGEEFFTDRGLQMLMNSDQGLFENCAIPQPASRSAQTEIGMYRFQNDEKVLSYKDTTKMSGTVFCGNREMGAGSLQSIRVSSAEVKAVPGSLNTYCGGAEIFNSVTVTVGDRVVYSARQEILQPQFK